MSASHYRKNSNYLNRSQPTGRSPMKPSARWFASATAIAAAAVTVMLATLVLAQDGARTPTDRPELEYLKFINRAAPPRDPQLVMLLMGQFANAGRSREGAEFFAAVTRKFSPQLDDGRKALYLSATALLRAQAA